MCWHRLGKIFPASNEGENLSKVQLVRGNDAPFARIGQCYLKHLYLDCPTRNPSGIGLNDDEPAVMQVIEECGHSFTHFYAIDAETGPSAQVLEAVSTHCTSIKNVCLKIPSPQAHPAIASTINSVLDSNRHLIEDLDVTANYSPFTFGSIEFPKLKALNLEIICELDLHLNLIQSCQSSLQRVRLRNFGVIDWHQVIAVLNSCHELRTIDLKDENIPEEELSNLLISRGPMLEYACVESLNDESCQKVIERCPNFKCEIFVFEKLLKKASILGTHVKSMRLFHSTSCDVAEMQLVSNRCTEVELFCSQDIEKDGGSAHAFFNTPKSELKEVLLQLLDLKSSSKLLECLSSATTSLRLFDIVVYYLTPHEIGGLSKLLQRNPNLEQVIIHSYGRCRLHEQRLTWVKILHVLRQLRRLKLVCLSSGYEENQSISQISFRHSVAKGVARSCVPFRNRGVLVRICGITICK